MDRRDDSRRQKYLVVIPFCDLADKEPSFWWALVDADTRAAALQHFEKVLNDERLLLCMLVDADHAADDLEGPNYLEEYGLTVGMASATALAHLPQWPDDFTTQAREELMADVLKGLPWTAGGK